MSSLKNLKEYKSGSMMNWKTYELKLKKESLKANKKLKY